MADQTDRILSTLNQRGVNYLLIGGLNFLLRHAPVLTYDVDVWIEDTKANCRRCETALADLRAEWGASDEDWGPVLEKPSDWLLRQAVCCLTSEAGAIDIFRAVVGLDSWAACRARAAACRTALGTTFWGLADADMLQCQLALPEGRRNEARIRYLQNVLAQKQS
ncbi:MAG: hypothetical protein ABFC54_04015 [Thermoguttaceae bacterium]